MFSRLAVFTLPHPDLNPAISRNADRLKRNAYHALIELNHYHLSSKGHVPKIKFWDGNEQTAEEPPWDIPYLAVPKGALLEDMEELHRAIADKIFINVFVPETQPDAKWVDATIFDRDKRAHVFCSFGLSSIEFPAQQVTEACGKRLMSFALKEWQARGLSDAEVEGRLAEIGFPPRNN